MNNHQIGIITDIRYVDIGEGKQCEVKVLVEGRDTNWLPKSTNVGGAFKMHVPPRVGDQVTVVNPDGNNEDGYVTANIAFEKIPHHKDIGPNKIIMWSSDGTTYIHDIKDKIISLDTPCKLIINTKGSVTLKSPLVVLEADVVIKGTLNVEGTISDLVGSLTAHSHLGIPGKVPLLRNQ